MRDSDLHSSVLLYKINYNCKKFNSTGSSGEDSSIETYLIKKLTQVTFIQSYFVDFLQYLSWLWNEIMHYKSN
jgi:hypothetical protein